MNVVLLKLQKYTSLNKGRRHTEMKLLIIICFFYIFTLCILTIVAVITVNTDEFRDNLSTYFACEARGEQECSKDNLTTYYTILGIIPYIVFVNMTLVYFIYIININACKQILNRVCSKQKI